MLCYSTDPQVPWQLTQYLLSNDLNRGQYNLIWNFNTFNTSGIPLHNNIL